MTAAMTADLIDIGANLGDKSFAKDLDEVLGRAAKEKVTRMIVTGTSVERSRESLALCREYPEALWCTAGIHPHHASTWNEEASVELRKLAEDPKVVAIGECGLDYNRNYSTPEEQRSCFRAHLEIACDLKMPIFLHERDALAEQVQILQEVGELPPAIIHCFTGNEEALRSYLDMGLYIGITGWICDERRGLHLRELVELIPEDRWMIETDAPYLLPRTIRPKPKSRRNEPSFLPYVLEVVAECRGISREEAAAQSTRNAESFFRL